MKRLIYLACALALFASVYGVMRINTYTTPVTRTVEVKQLYAGETGGRHSRMQFIAVFETKDGILFDQPVSASNYYLLQPGDKVTMELTPMSIKQTGRDNAIWFFGAVFYYVAASVTGVALLISACWPSKNKVVS